MASIPDARPQIIGPRPLTTFRSKVTTRIKCYGAHASIDEDTTDLLTMTAYRDHVPDQDEDAGDRLEPDAVAAVVDVFVYVVVLNLFVEYLPQVLSETFTLSLLTAVLLKGVLEVVVAAKNRVKARFRRASTPIGKVLAAVLLWLVLFGSKFLVLEAVNLVFGARVSLGGFFSVTLLILVLLLSRAAVRRLLQRPHQRAQGQG
jgi:hypothetical protein